LRSLQNFSQSEWRLPTPRSSFSAQLLTGHLPALHEPTRWRTHAPCGPRGRPQSARAHAACSSCATRRPETTVFCTPYLRPSRINLADSILKQFLVLNLLRGIARIVAAE
jgi:hypothetical protein